MKNKQYHYAFMYPCGVITRAETGRLYRHVFRFPSREERDKWVAMGNDTARTMPDYRASTTRDEARADLRRVVYWCTVSETAERGY